MSRTREDAKRCAMCLKRPLSRDEVGINRKLLDPDTDTFFCMDCLAGYLDCTVQDLLDKIEEFKDGGCTMFE